MGVLVFLVVVVFWLIQWRYDATRRPTRIARRRIAAQLAAVNHELASLPTPDPQLPALHEDVARSNWVLNTLRNTPIADLGVSGMGESSVSALRAAGFRFALDLPRLAPGRVPSIGEKRCSQLLEAYQQLRGQLQFDAKKLGRAELDRLTSGELGRTIREHEATTLDAARKSEGLRIRLEELGRRASCLP